MVVDALEVAQQIEPPRAGLGRLRLPSADLGELLIRRGSFEWNSGLDLQLRCEG